MNSCLKRLSRYVSLSAVSLFLAIGSIDMAAADGDIEKAFDCDKSKLLDIPNSLVNKTVIYQISNAQTALGSGVPYQGAAVETYDASGQYQGQGYGTMKQDVPLNQQIFSGQYRYKRTGLRTAEVRGVDTMNGKVPFVTTYRFDTGSSGKWEQNWGNGRVILSGEFVIQRSSVDVAPATNANLITSLWIKNAESDVIPAGAYPSNAFAIQTYKPDNTLTIKGYGQAAQDFTGTYRYTKIAPNVAVEEAVQTNSTFTLPYTMVYIFDTPNSGRWFQNLGDGLIKFSGTFGSVPQ